MSASESRAFHSPVDRLRVFRQMRPRARDPQTSGQRVGLRLVEYPQHNAVVGLDRPISELVELAPPSGDELQAIFIARKNHQRFARGAPEPVDPAILDPFTASEVDELSAIAGELRPALQTLDLTHR